MRMAFAGDKLIDHLKHWLNPEEVSGGTGPVAWALGEQPAVAAAILELFHLLPAQSAKFMETEGAGPRRCAERQYLMLMT